MEHPFTFFIAGIIQGSRQDLDVYDQSYRDRIKHTLCKSFPASQIYCPVERHPDSPKYTNEKAREVFMKHIDRIRDTDVLIVYLPEASLGCAIEMWEAHQKHKVIITVSPMATNWIVRLLSDRVFRDLEAFIRFTESGQLLECLMRKSRVRS